MRSLTLAVALLTAAGCTDTPADSDAPSNTAASADSVDVRMVREDSTGVEMPRVTLPGKPDVEARVNTSLDSLAASMRCEVYEGGPSAEDMSFEARTAVTHAADDVLSVSVHAAYECGGAYPTNDANMSVTYDLTSGEQVSFEGLFRDYDADRAAIAGVLQSTLAPTSTGGEEDCAELFTTEAMQSMSFSYALDEAGVLVQPSFPHVTEACAEEVTIPYASLRPFAADGSVLARVAAGAVSR